MQVAKLGASGVPNAVKPEEGNDSLGTLVHQTMGKESLISFSRTGDSPVQWIQLLNSLDQPDILGWPMFTPIKMQLQKCEKCSLEFCSPINYRRHIRVHRRRSRSLNVDKEAHKSRDLLGSFWDNLSLEDAKNVVSFDDISLKEVSGSSIIKALANALRKPGVWTMPHTYVQAGSSLLEIVQDRYSRQPIHSRELFVILDDASERTFLCAGTAESVQKFIIDGGAEEALEMRNLIASVSLLLEQKLVRAWLANKDAESLRCQKLLVEEEEAAEKRRSQLLERKKQKQLRQQEQKAREQSNFGRIDNITDSGDSSTDSVDGPSVSEIPVSQVSSNNNQGLLTEMNSLIKPPQLSNEATVGALSDFSSDQISDDSLQNFVSWMEMENEPQRATPNEWQVPKSRSQRIGKYGSQNFRTLKPVTEPSQKQGPLKDRNVVNSGKIWTRKSKEEISDASSEIILRKKETNNIVKSNPDLLIGSISVPVRSCSAEKYATQGVLNVCSKDSASSKDNFPKEILKSDSAQEEIDQATGRLITISPAERSDIPVQIGNQDNDIVASGKVKDKIGYSGENCLQSCHIDRDHCDKTSCLEENYQPQGMPFSSDAAKAFLEQRWKDAISSNHVTLVLSYEAPGRPDSQNDSSLMEVPSSGVLDHGDSKTHLPNTEAHCTPTEKNTGTKFKGSQRKG